MAELVLLCLPTIVYLIAQSRGQDRRSGFRAALARAGVSWGSPAGYGWALLVLLLLMLTAWLPLALIPADVQDKLGLSIARLTSVGTAIGITLRAVGEEVFFRGLLGGVLMRRLSFRWGNLLQATIFLVPHVALLLLDVRLWPILTAQLAAGWLLGWLRHKTDTFVPGAVLHVIINITVGLLTARRRLRAEADARLRPATD